MEICRYTDCTGCATCTLICPRHAIEMRETIEGFLYPVINEDICVHCNLCIDICPSSKEVKRNSNKNVRAYSFINADDNVRQSSSSGGMFHELGRAVITRNGAVYGAVYSDIDKVEIVRTNTLDGLAPMIGSKYVESATGEIFLKVKKDLINNIPVLFTGLPCQIAGLYSYLKEYANSDNLLTVDLLCHGVPSSGLFRSYIQYLQSIYYNISDFTFRDKTKWGWGSWGSFSYEKKGKRKKKYFFPASDYYYGLYYKENCLRESCYRCKYCKIPRIGDITIGDFWGIEKYKGEKEIKKGVSLVLVNNNHAEQFLINGGTMSSMEEWSVAEASVLNKSIIEPANRPHSRDCFYQDNYNFGFIENAKSYVKIKTITPVLARYIPKTIKVVLKSLGFKR